MVNVEELKTDMRSGMTIEEVLNKHQIDLPTALKLLAKHKIYVPKKRTKTRYIPTNEPLIHHIQDRYYIRKSIKGKTKTYGSYESLEDAIKVRDYMIENGWYFNRLKTAWKRCGVEGRIGRH